MVERGVHAILARHNLSLQSVKAIATVERKADEPAFLYLRDRYGWPLETYPAETLDAVLGIENPSDTVLQND
jgi:cobalt-precorrin 5A hydrolase